MGYLRHALRSLFAGDAERAHIAVSDLLHGCGWRIKADRGMTCDHRRDRRASAVERDVHEVELKRQTKLFPREM